MQLFPGLKKRTDGGKMLYHLIYRSKAKGPVNWESLKNIMQQSQDKNSASDLTGMLFYSGQIFLQILEGDQAQINRVYSDICKDDRHENIELLVFCPINKRHFSNWNMRLIQYSSIDPNMQEFMTRKYGVMDQAVQVPSDHYAAFSLLLDIYTMDQMPV